MSSKHFVYENIVGRIEVMINEGVLKPGEKAPSLRRLSNKLGVSITSVMRAYTVLEDRGLLEASPQSGFYVRELRSSIPALRVTAPKVERMPVHKSNLIVSFLESINDPDNILFGCASPGLSHLPLDELGKIISTLGRESREEVLDYMFPPGCADLRREIGKRSLEWGCSLRPRDIVVTSGGLDALNLSLRAVVKPGDAIAIESPTYFGVLQVIENLGCEAVELPTCPCEGVDLDVLEGILKRKAVKACLLIPNFNNPMGHLMPEENKKRLAHLLWKYQTPLIEDDVYGDLYFDSKRPKSVKAFDRDGMVILCSSFSKSLSPGLRVGFAASERYADVIKNLQFMSTLAAPSIAQSATARFLSSGKYDRHLRKMRRALKQDQCRYLEAITELFPEGTRVSRPRGGFVLWLALPQRYDTVTLYRKAMEKRISFAPGALFTSQKDFHNYMRLNCGHPWSSEVERALHRLADLLSEHK